MPLIYSWVALLGEYTGREVGRESLSCSRMSKIPVTDGKLYKGDVLFWAEQYLERLPPYEASDGERWNRRRGKVLGLH